MKRPLTPKILDIYLSLGRELIPLKRDDKRPLHTEWTQRRYTPSELLGYVKKGANIGWRLGPLDCIIDVDPRNGGAEALKQLREDLMTFDLSETYPTVQTGGGGWHYYTSLPERISIRKGLTIYPGIDFLGYGRYILIAGCSHPSGDPYRFDELSPFRRPSPALPDHIYQLIAKFDLEDDIAKISACHTIPSKMLRDLLKELPIEDFRSDSEWFPMMCAAHHATQGYGLRYFLEWSLGDPQYSEHADLIKRRWRSLSHDDRPSTDRPITINAIYAEVLRRGKELPPLAIVRDFEVIDGLDVDEIEADLEPEPVIAKKVSRAKVIREARRLNKMSAAKAIQIVLDKCIAMDNLDVEQILGIIRMKTERPLPSLRKTLAERRRRHLSTDDAIEDLGYLLASETLSHARDHHKSDLIYAIDSRFWEFQRTHWVPLSMAAVRNRVLRRAKAMKRNNPSVVQPVASLVNQGMQLLEAETADEGDVFGFARPPTPIVNTLNCSVHLNIETGDAIARGHDRDDHLTHVLQTEFSSVASCPLFDRTLEEIFAYHLTKDRREIIRHLWEVLGYTIQPHKDIAAWILFHGHGSNGKTLILNILSAILGPFALEKPVGELDTIKYTHAFADLPGKLAVIDEDVQSRTVMPDGAIKKVSENKMLVANPKNQPTYRFLNTAVTYLSSNHWPRTSDLSHGLKRRALVFDFDRRFTPLEQDLSRGKTIIETELPGVLNRALEGLRRLRFRGNFKIPAACKIALEKWYKESNQVLRFIEERLVSTAQKSKGAAFDAVWDAYVEWSHDQGARRSYSKPGLRQAFESMDYEIENGKILGVWIDGSAKKGS